jgi:hypothetical protein
MKVKADAQGATASAVARLCARSVEGVAAAAKPFAARGGVGSLSQPIHIAAGVAAEGRAVGGGGGSAGAAGASAALGGSVARSARRTRAGRITCAAAASEALCPGADVVGSSLEFVRPVDLVPLEVVCRDDLVRVAVEKRQPGHSPEGLKELDDRLSGHWRMVLDSV